MNFGFKFGFGKKGPSGPPAPSYDIIRTWDYGNYSNPTVALPNGIISFIDGEQPIGPYSTGALSFYTVGGLDQESIIDAAGNHKWVLTEIGNETNQLIADIGVSLADFAAGTKIVNWQSAAQWTVERPALGAQIGIIFN